MTALNDLLLAHRQVARAGARLRLAIPPRGPVGRVVELTGINRYIPVDDGRGRRVRRARAMGVTGAG